MITQGTNQTTDPSGTLAISRSSTNNHKPLPDRDKTFSSSSWPHFIVPTSLSQGLLLTICYRTIHTPLLSQGYVYVLKLSHLLVSPFRPHKTALFPPSAVLAIDTLSVSILQLHSNSYHIAFFSPFPIASSPGQGQRRR